MMFAMTSDSVGEIIKEVIPFLIVLILALLLMILIPEIVLWLPKLFGYLG